MTESEQILVLGGGPEISQVGYPLVDGTASGQLALSDSAPHINTLPVPVVEGQRWVKDPEDVEYLGRWVVSLDGPDTMTFPVVTSDIKNNSWDIYGRVTDKGAATATSSFIMIIKTGSVETLGIRMNSAGNLTVILRDGTGALWAERVNTSKNVENITFEFRVQKVDNLIYLWVDGTPSASLDATLWPSGTAVTSAYFSDTTSAIRPLEVCCLQQYLEGSLLDWFKCDEPTGETEIINYGSRSTPATLSDAAAHALANVPQPTKSQGVWIWDGSQWVLQDNYLVYDLGNPITDESGNLISIYGYPEIEVERDGSVFVDRDGKVLIH